MAHDKFYDVRFNIGIGSHRRKSVPAIVWQVPTFYPLTSEFGVVTNNTGQCFIPVKPGFIYKLKYKGKYAFGNWDDTVFTGLRFITSNNITVF